jgi:hypothetical protein
MPVTHDALVARLGLEIGIPLQEVSDFRHLLDPGNPPIQLG